MVHSIIAVNGKETVIGPTERMTARSLFTYFLRRQNDLTAIPIITPKCHAVVAMSCATTAVREASLCLSWDTPRL
jgi:hypothetical protein